ncbi:MAG: AAA family ATPase [Zetaproteobacteria bacterium]|nr:AAA family ATPase [Zetaproteobacteria bacterium]
MKIKHITIQNFKGFKNESFSFNPNITVLIGDNGSGKTTVLEALSFVLGTFFLGVDGIPSRSLRQNEKRRVAVSSDNIEVQLPFSISVEHSLAGQDFSWTRDTNKKLGGATTYKDAHELIDMARAFTASVSDKNAEPVNLPLIAYYGTGRLAREKHEKLAYAKQGSRLDGYYIALDPTTCKKRFLGWFKSFEDAKLKFNKKDDLYRAFTTAITSMVPGWNEVHFSWEADDMFGQLNDGEWMPFADLSDGFQNVIRLTADIAYRAVTLNPHLGENAVLETEGVVLIDELDMHLHPTWQKSVIADLKKTFPNIQFIITTHSPFIVQSLRSDELINLGTQSGGNPFTKSIEEIAETYMQVANVQRSKRFLTMQNLASQYFDLIEQGKTAVDDNQTFELKERLDKIELEFNADPVFIALMKAERRSAKRNEPAS